MSVPVLTNFINGEFVPMTGRATVDVVSPSTGDVLCKVPLSTATDLDAAVAHGQKAFEGWSNITIKQRAAIMFKFHSLVDKHSDEVRRSSCVLRVSCESHVSYISNLSPGLLISLPK